jgi:hypothetical protein
MTDEKSTTLDRDDSLIKTYRYLRVAMVVLVIVLGVSILIEWRKTVPNCLQGSISAYYYTPVQPILVGALLAISTCLIAVKGNSKWEDTALNLGGMLAPVVALVPTSGTGSCMSVPFAGQKTGPGISNNFVALLIGGGIAAAIGLGTALIDRKANRKGGIGKPTWVGLGLASGLIVGAIVWYNAWHGAFLEGAHFTAAIAMFVFVGWASGTNGFRLGHFLWNPYRWLVAKEGGWARLYRFVPIGMAAVGGAIGLIGWRSESEHTVFVLEVVEIGFFTLFWTAQSIEQWNRGIRTT